MMSTVLQTVGAGLTVAAIAVLLGVWFAVCFVGVGLFLLGAAIGDAA